MSVEAVDHGAVRDPRAVVGAVAGRVGFVAPLVVLLALQQVLWPAPAGVVLNGVIVGGRIALVALGIALVYRANRVVNFAQGDLGAVPASLAVMLIAATGVNYYLSFLTGLAAAVVLGVLVETLVIRRFFRAPRLILMVATIGLSQLLSGAGLFLPRLFGGESIGERIAPPFDLHFTVAPTRFDANDVLTLLLVPAALGALALFLRRSSVGIAIRGAAERADRAAMLGVPVKRLHTVVWVVATVLAFLAMFLRAGSVGLPIGSVLPATILVQALAAVVIGRMDRFASITAAALGLGIVDQCMTFQPGNRPAYNDAVLFAIVLAGVLLSRPGPGRRAGAGDTSTWQAVADVRPVPRELARLPEVRAGRAALAVVLAAAALTLPLWLPTDRVNLAAGIVVFAIVGLSLVVLTGWAGQVSLGQMAFVGLGAAVAGSLTSHRGWDLILALGAAGVAGAVAAVVVGWPALRRRGLALAVTTLGFALFTSSYLLNRSVLRSWLPDLRIERPALLGRIDIGSERAFYYLCLAVLALAVLAVRGVRHSRTGRVLIATRENEDAARGFGVDTTGATLGAFALSGFVAAVAGGLLVHLQTGLTSGFYEPAASLSAFSMTVIGGLGSIPGALLGAAYVRGSYAFLPAEWQFLATGAGLLLVLMVLPGGLGAALFDVRDALLRRVARRRGLLVPSLLADSRAPDAAHAADATDAAHAPDTASSADGPSTDAAAPARAGASR